MVDAWHADVGAELVETVIRAVPEDLYSTVGEDDAVQASWNCAAQPTAGQTSDAGTSVGLAAGDQALAAARRHGSDVPAAFLDPDGHRCSVNHFPVMVARWRAPRPERVLRPEQRALCRLADGQVGCRGVLPVRPARLRLA